MARQDTGQRREASQPEEAHKEAGRQKPELPYYDDDKEEDDHDQDDDDDDDDGDDDGDGDDDDDDDDDDDADDDDYGDDDDDDVDDEMMLMLMMMMMLMMMVTLPNPPAKRTKYCSYSNLTSSEPLHCDLAPKPFPINRELRRTNLQTRKAAQTAQTAATKSASARQQPLQPTEPPNAPSIVVAKFCAFITALPNRLQQACYSQTYPDTKEPRRANLQARYTVWTTVTISALANSTPFQMDAPSEPSKNATTAVSQLLHCRPQPKLPKQHRTTPRRPSNLLCSANCRCQICTRHAKKGYLQRFAPSPPPCQTSPNNVAEATPV